jgi:hypothetical protein
VEPTVVEPDPVDELLAEWKLTHVTASRSFVGGRLKQAAENVDSAKLIVASNSRAAVTLVYDAIRFAVDAHMQAGGLRVANTPGAHRASVIYSRARLTELVDASDLDTYEALREVRNQIEYPETDTRNAVDVEDAAEVVATGERIVVAITSWWVRE